MTRSEYSNPGFYCTGICKYTNTWARRLQCPVDLLTCMFINFSVYQPFFMTAITNLRKLKMLWHNKTNSDHTPFGAELAMQLLTNFHRETQSFCHSRTPSSQLLSVFPHLYSTLCGGPTLPDFLHDKKVCSVGRASEPHSTATKLGRSVEEVRLA